MGWVGYGSGGWWQIEVGRGCVVGEGGKNKQNKNKNRVKQGNTEKSPKSRLNHDLFYSSSVKLMNFCVYSPKVILKSSPRIASNCGGNDSNGVVLHFEECSSWIV